MGQVRGQSAVVSFCSQTNLAKAPVPCLALRSQSTLANKGLDASRDHIAAFISGWKIAPSRLKNPANHLRDLHPSIPNFRENHCVNLRRIHADSPSSALVSEMRIEDATKNARRVTTPASPTSRRLWPSSHDPFRSSPARGARSLRPSTCAWRPPPSSIRSWAGGSRGRANPRARG